MKPSEKIEEEINMKIHNYDTNLDELLDCPFCGSKPVAHLIGNQYSSKKYIIIKCKNCNISRKVGAIKNSIEWLEEISIKLWNTRE